jgi:hypothetical protein
METWLDTETKAILQRSPPKKLAPPDTGTFALVLLAVSGGITARLTEAVERILRSSPREAAQRVLSLPVPSLVAGGLSYEDALLGQFELISCDAVSVFLAGEVVTNAPKNYLVELFAHLRHSPEFQPVELRIESLPSDTRRSEFLDRFVGAGLHPLPLRITAMRKKARIMEHWAAKIGGRVVLGGK